MRIAELEEQTSLARSPSLRPCHTLNYTTGRNYCGTPLRNGRHRHTYEECVSRRHERCVVCEDMSGYATR
jgi:hypothetical protein